MKSTMLQAVLFSALTLLTTFSIAQNEEEKKFIDAQTTFEQSLAGDETKTQGAIDVFQSLVNNNLEQPLFLAYLGSSYTLKARDSWMPWTRLKNVEMGLEKIDKAILMLNKKHDEQKLRGSIISTETRLVAISSFLQVPGFLNRFQDAKDLMDETLSSSAYKTSPQSVKGRLQLRAADIAFQEEDFDARYAHLKLALALLPSGKFSTQVREQLAEISRNEMNEKLDKEFE